MEESLNKIRVPHVVHGDTICNSVDHVFEIERYYAGILNFIHLSDLQLPRSKPTVPEEY